MLLSALLVSLCVFLLPTGSCPTHSLSAVVSVIPGAVSYSFQSCPCAFVNWQAVDLPLGCVLGSLQ